MAIFHFRVKTISRAKGQSAVAASAYRAAEKLKEYQLKKEQERQQEKKQSIDDIIKAAAYRAGEKIKDQEKSITHDYTKKGHVVHKEIILPKDAPEKFKDRQILWNEVNKIEKRKDARLAREVVIGLHRELDLEQNKKLLKDYVKENFTSKGLVADIAIHNPSASDGLKNLHAHVLLTTREIDKNGFSKTKNREWDKNEKVENWRKSWAEHSNQKFKDVGAKRKIDHRSYKDRGIDKIPQIHIGKAAMAMEKRGIKTERGERLKEIKFQNTIRQSLKLISDPERRKEFEKHRIIQRSREWINKKLDKGLSRDR